MFGMTWMGSFSWVRVGKVEDAKLHFEVEKRLGCSAAVSITRNTTNELEINNQEAAKEMQICIHVQADVRQ